MKNTVLTVAMAGCCTAVLLCGGAASGLAQTQAPTQQVAQQPTVLTKQPPAEVKVLRELHGVKLGMPRDRVNKALGKPAQTAQQTDEFKLDGGDLLTVRYDPQGAVDVIQLYCTDAKRAPAWADVTGDAQIEHQPSGAKVARKDVPAENFWVTMFQSQSGAVTTITISRQHN
jgi:hypothetical protein